ncbi:hypothetical protein B0F90DRAFT_1709914 [Multifurca ochricompacta]|uniref:Uncharacterized protein n=1 Tax=Multifurca ochricompacta TaxID=376703 RepID=A0AAD4M609_9AGAM|nr:hypothetical protein B0F90DRAFT_1709914 [Multifurca ochricompacta]
MELISGEINLFLRLLLFPSMRSRFQSSPYIYIYVCVCVCTAFSLGRRHRRAFSHTHTYTHNKQTKCNRGDIG